MVVTNEALLETIDTAKKQVLKHDFKNLISVLIIIAENSPREIRQEAQDIIPAVARVARTGVFDEPAAESLIILLDNLKINLLKYMEKVAEVA